MTKLEITVFSSIICFLIIVMFYSNFVVKNEQGKELMQDFIFRSIKKAGKEPDPTKLYYYDKKTNQIFIKDNPVMKGVK